MRVQGQSGLHIKALSQRKENEQEEEVWKFDWRVLAQWGAHVSNASLASVLSINTNKNRIWETFGIAVAETETSRGVAQLFPLVSHGLVALNSSASFCGLCSCVQ